MADLRAVSEAGRKLIQQRVFGREDVDKCFRPCLPGLRWFGRRVGTWVPV